jgi:chemotaxis signal transduction protein
MNERDIFPLRVGEITFAVPSGAVEMYLDPNKPLADPPPGSSGVVVGVLKWDDDDITIVDLRRLFGADESSAKPGWLVITYGGRRYGLVVDGFEDPVHLNRDVDPDLLEMDFPLPRAIPYLIGVIPSEKAMLDRVMYPVDLSRVLAAQTLMVN